MAMSNQLTFSPQFPDWVSTEGVDDLVTLHSCADEGVFTACMSGAIAQIESHLVGEGFPGLGVKPL